jgi:small subunit ribosomal protein S8
MMTDPIADMLTRLRNATMAHKDDVIMPASSLKEEIAKILLTEGYVEGVQSSGDGKDRVITVRLKYGQNRERTMTGLRRISKPGHRVYVDHDGIPRVMGGLGIAILSTSHGVLTDRQARRAGVGGEVLAYVW